MRIMFRHPLYPFMLADVDFFVRMPDGSFAILECKTCNYNAKDKWADGNIPDHYVYQVRHYMAVMNIHHAFIACLWGNSEKDFVYYPLDRDLLEEENIIEQEEYFWTEYVEKKVEPPLSGKPDLVLASIRRYSGYADKSIPEISISGLEARSLERYLLFPRKNPSLKSGKKRLTLNRRRSLSPL